MTSPSEASLSATSPSASQSTTVEDSLSAWQINDFSDRWNPMLVRELRRMLKSRLFGAAFLLLLIGCLGSSYVLVAMYPGFVQHGEAGKQFAYVYLWLLTVSLMFVVPLSMFLAVSQERSGETLEMLSITTLSSGQILGGFLMCGLAHALLYLSVLVPFISFSYLLMGLGLGELLICLLFLGLLGLPNAVWSTMWGACVTGNFSRIVCFIFSILGNLLAFYITMLLNSAVLYSESDIGLKGLASFVPGLIVYLLILILALSAIAWEQLSIHSIEQKPYGVILDEQGNVIQFKPYYDDPYYGDAGAPIPKELLESLKPPAPPD